MSYLVDLFVEDQEDSAWPSRFKEAWRDYHAYLASQQSRIPASALAFAIAEWHYNANDKRCPHDSRVKSFVLFKTHDAKRDHRYYDARMTLLGAYEDREIFFEYERVRRLQVGSGNEEDLSDVLGDWIIDEVRVSKSGFVMHEILFRSGARWQIECENLNHSEALLSGNERKLDS